MIESITNRTIALVAIVMTVLCVIWNLEIPTRLGFAVLTQQYISVQLGFALLITFLSFSQDKSFLRPIWLIGCATILVTFVYMTINFDWLLTEQSYRPIQITIIGTVIVICVLEGIRRRIGIALFSIVIVFIGYALIAEEVPGELVGRSVPINRLIDYIGFDGNAVFSSPLVIATTVVILFVFFGRLLFAAGGGLFLTDLAMACAGNSRGGSAKIAVMGSAMFGSISGSAVSNVVSTGVITIPLMTKSGYTAKDAGAIEAVASTGGQLTPPIMGAAAFLMAEFLEIPYMAVVTAALLPAVLYYVSVFTQIDLIAARDNIRGAETDHSQTVKEILQEGWHFLIPIGLLIGSLFYWDLDPEDSAIVSAASICVIGALRPYKGNRLSFGGFTEVLVETGTSVVDLVLIVAASGFIIGILNITGLGFALTLFLVNLVESQLILLLIISALVCIVLGMGMPTSGVYVLLATLVAPALVESGISPISAHLFILYFGMMSMITPPVALASFTAAMLAKTDPLKTSIASLRVGWAAFMLPFIFVQSSGLALEGDVQNIAEALVFSIVGILAITAAITGFWLAPLKLYERFILISLGLLTLPSIFVGDIGLINHLATSTLIVAILLFKKFMSTKHKTITNIESGRKR
jgi:TRAP transporter 4TM/12TM fusion protein